MAASFIVAVMKVFGFVAAGIVCVTMLSNCQTAAHKAGASEVRVAVWKAVARENAEVQRVSVARKKRADAAAETVLPELAAAKDEYAAAVAVVVTAEEQHPSCPTAEEWEQLASCPSPW